MSHFSADRQPIEVGKKFWNNDLRVCQVTEVASHSNGYPGGHTQTWHQTTHGSFDTVTPHHPNLGRLVRYYEGKDAEEYEAGTNFADAAPKPQGGWNSGSSPLVHKPHPEYLRHNMEDDEGWYLYGTAPCLCNDPSCVWSLGAPINRYYDGEQVTGL